MVTKERQISQSIKNELINALKVICWLDDEDIEKNRLVLDVIVSDIYREYELDLKKALIIVNTINPMAIIQKLKLPESIFSDDAPKVDSDEDITLGRTPELTFFDDDPDLDTQILD